LFFIIFLNTYWLFSLETIWTNDFGDFDDFGVMMTTSSMVTAWQASRIKVKLIFIFRCFFFIFVTDSFL